MSMLLVDLMEDDPQVVVEEAWESGEEPAATGADESPAAKEKDNADQAHAKEPEAPVIIPPPPLLAMKGKHV